MTDNTLTSTSVEKIKLIFFRFISTYLLIYNLPFPIKDIVYLEIIANFYIETSRLLTLWIGRNIFGITGLTHFFSNSGDTTFNYVEITTVFFLSIIVTTFWTLKDRKVTSFEKYKTFHNWFRVYLRFSLGSIMIFYGAIKLIKSQFPDPSLLELLQPIGNASPMRLVWTFMGYSEAYCAFTGGAEILGGVLLAFPQTTLLGVLLCMGVISNIMMLNFFYDVPVKIFSSHLMFMCLFLLGKDLNRLIKVLILNQTVEKEEIRPLFTKTWKNNLAQITKAVFLSTVVLSSLQTADNSRKSYGDLAIKSPLYGVWEVEEFEQDGKILPPLLTDETRWRRVILDSPKDFVIHYMTNLQEPFNVTFQPEGKIFLTKIDPSSRGNFQVEIFDDNFIKLTGELKTHKIIAKLRKKDISKFLLKSRGFNWVNEFPYNR
jgi:hypothetical protein